MTSFYRNDAPQRWGVYKNRFDALQANTVLFFREKRGD